MSYSIANFRRTTNHPKIPRLWPISRRFPAGSYTRIVSTNVSFRWLVYSISATNTTRRKESRCRQAFSTNRPRFREIQRGSEFLRLANALTALYPPDSEKGRLLDATLLAVPR